MRSLVDVALLRARTFYLLLVLIFVGGVYSYVSIPKESSPDIPLPVAYVSISHEGISPEDAVNLLVKPLETELKSIEGLDELEASAYEGGANVVLHFSAGVDNDKAIDDTRNQVDIAKAELPDEADEPIVRELNISTFPILTIILGGDMPERELKRIAENLQDRIEGLSGVLEARIVGLREEQLLIDIDRNKLESYAISPALIPSIINNANKLVAAGSIELETGRYAIKVPGLFHTADDVLDLPLITQGDNVVRIRDIADVKLTFKDPVNISRVNGNRALTINVSKRIGKNVIETVDAVKAVVDDSATLWPEGLEYSYTGDESIQIRTMLNDLQNSVILAVLLVMIVILAALGPRSSLLVATAIPGSFLMAMMVLYGIGFTTNVVVLFALILSVGMLVDGAIVVTELADTRLREGHTRREAFSTAAKYMAMPIIASTATTLAAFLPLIFWPGIVGEFMKFMPITLIFTLSASLIMALIFLPMIGATIGKRPTAFSPDIFDGVAASYARLLNMAIDRPKQILFACVVFFIGACVMYGVLGKGVEFFPDIEVDRANILVHAAGDYSIYEKDAVLLEAQKRLVGLEGVETLTVQTGGDSGGNPTAPDVIGKIFLQLYRWEERDVKADDVFDEALRRIHDIPGVRMEVQKAEEGPSSGKPIQVVVASENPRLLSGVVDTLYRELKAFEGTLNVEHDMPTRGIEWSLAIDRTEAARMGTNLSEAGTMLRLGTTGAIVGTYRPDNGNDELDIVARFKDSQRSFDTLDTMLISTENGHVPMSNFITRSPQQKVTTISRLDQKYTYKVEADVAPGVLADDVVNAMKALVNTYDIPQGVDILFKGEDEDQKEASAFLSKAFMVAIFMMAMILVTQFNSFYQAFIILSAVVLSTAGVLIGHIIMMKPFGVVMSGLGVIALAGIVVNNNIVLIDTYNKNRQEMGWREALIATGTSRLRPVLLTAITTIVGLLPLGFKVNVDMMARELTYNAPSSQWWDQLANSIMFGLTFATVLTLIVTPCMIALGEMRRAKKEARKNTSPS